MMRQAIVVTVDTSAAARLAHVREFLKRVDRHFPIGIPLEITYAIRDELQILEAAVVTDRSAGGPIAAGTLYTTGDGGPESFRPITDATVAWTIVGPPRPCAYCGVETRGSLEAWRVEGHHYCTVACARATGSKV